MGASQPPKSGSIPPSAKQGVSKGTKIKTAGELSKKLLELDKLQEETDENRKKLDELAKSPEKQREYEELKKTIDTSLKDLTDADQQLRVFQAPPLPPPIDLMEEDTGAHGVVPPNDGSFSPGSPTLGDTSDPKPGNLDPYQSGGEHNIDDDDDGLFTPADFRQATGQRNDGEVVAWQDGGRSTRVIIGYGPKNARRYERSTAAKAGYAFDESVVEQFGPDHRLGDKKIGRRLIRKMSEFKGICGVAFDGDIELLRPKSKGEKRTYPTTDIYVKWQIQGVTKKIWENRSSISHLFAGPAMSQNYIYIFAKDQAQRHQFWLDGQLVGKDKSPTPAPDLSPLLQGNGNRIKAEGGGAPMPEPKAGLTGIHQFKADYCEMQGIENASNMTAEQMGQFIKAWNSVKQDY